MTGAQIAKLLISQPGTWVEFYVQSHHDINRSGDRRARNRANGLRMYARRTGYPIDVISQIQDDGLIHCWGRWNEGGESSTTRPNGQ